ncbi:SusE domain-containing protein [Gaoshiqia sp. Z1-71]|uniref:SusE domain-containing protein n=1 Tax=Gaoshiqia hydrogeniformans TaxID=3290090 RepID=UPI003BF77C15
MKKILIRLTVIASLLFAIAACEDDGGNLDTRLTAVGALIEPMDGKEVTLETSVGASTYFEWEYCKVEESGTALYQIAFDQADGDFSNPVYLTPADNNGMYNNVTITHKQLNKIAGMMGIGSSETGTFKWTVFSSKGLKSVKGEEERSITITRLAGFADLPVDVYVTGEASEGGADLSKAHQMKAIAGGEFETYTQLTAGEPFYFTDGTSGTPRVFYTDGGLVKENGTSTVAITGVYRITLDFNTGACTYALVTRVSFYFSPEGKILFDLPYAGNGIFRAEDQTVTFKQESWGRDERYKFRMVIKENGGADAEKELEWGTLNGTDSRPTATSPESYYYIKLLNPTQWDNKWKLMGDFDGVPADYTIYLQAGQPYTHSVTK